jgi:hypothetical protein
LILKGLGFWDWSGKTNTKTQLKGICLSPRVSIPLVIDSFHTHSHVLGGVYFWAWVPYDKGRYPAGMRCICLSPALIPWPS